MPSDNILALLALLFLWLLERFHRRSRAEEPEEGRSRTKVEGWKDVEVIEGLPARPLAFSATVRVSDDGSEDGPSQTVDLSDLSCTCKEFRSRRARLPENSVGRICSHVSQALRETGVTSSFDDVLRTIVESGPTRSVYYQATLRSGEKVAVGHDPGSDQVDVITRPRPVDQRSRDSTGPYRRYGYSVTNGRWLVDTRPPGAVEIGELIDELPLKG